MTPFNFIATLTQLGIHRARLLCTVGEVRLFVSKRNEQEACTIVDLMPMGVKLKVERLHFWQCWFPKFQVKVKGP